MDIPFLAGSNPTGNDTTDLDESSLTTPGGLGSIIHFSPPTCLNFVPYGFLYTRGHSPLELLFAHNPVVTALISTLTTPALLCLFCTSRTIRHYLHHHPRFFTNLFLVSDAEGARWVEKNRYADAVKVYDEAFPWEVAVDAVAAMRRVKITVNERKLLLAVCLEKFVRGSPRLERMFVGTHIGAAQVRWLARRRGDQRYIPSLRSRHLDMVIKNNPVGGRLSTLVLDGTGVETEHMKVLLLRIEGTLRGLSVKNCPNLECYLWPEWLLEAIDGKRAVALKWIHIWGSGNTPNNIFDFTTNPDPVEPLEPHKDDPQYVSLPDPGEWAPKASLFANVIPLRFHLEHTLKLLPPMTLSGGTRANSMNEIIGIIQSQYRDFRLAQKADPKAKWFAPNYPLGDPHPLVAFMVVTKFLSLKTDIALCVNKQNCYSFANRRPHLSGNRTAYADVPSSARRLVVDPQTGRMVPYIFSALGEEEEITHTHSVAEIDARRHGGGTVCQNCGLWEDELSPEEHRGEGDIKEYGGIRFGPAVGIGRIAVGSCCQDCVREMTCVGCNSFYCPSCTFKMYASPTAGPKNPLAADPPGPKHLKWTCPQGRHGPFCKDCEDCEKSHLTCIDCRGSICYGCHGPAGTTISSSLYTKDGWTPEMEKERFGVVGGINEWEIGAYMGWGGAPESESMLAEVQATSPANGPTEFQSSDDDFVLSNADDEVGETSSDNLHDIFDENDNSTTSSYSNIMSSVLSSLSHHRSSSSRTSADTSTPLALSYGDPFKRLCETRIWEECSRCGIGTCAGCLGYEEDTYEPGKPKYIVQEPEYRNCSAGCGRRFCLSCIRQPTTGPGELECGKIWEIDREAEFQFDEYLYKGLMDMPNGKKGFVCGAVLCAECQVGEMLIRPSVLQGYSGDQVERRRDDQNGVWVCAHCELGIRPSIM